MDQVDIAWVAGILEGEGTFTLTGRGRRPQIGVQMTDRDIIDRLQRTANCGTVHGPTQSKGGRHKPLHNWRVSDRRSVARMLLAVYPLMGERRQARIAELVERLDYRGTGDIHCKACGGMNWNYRPDRPTQRYCRDCRVAYGREWRREQKEVA